MGGRGRRARVWLLDPVSARGIHSEALEGLPHFTDDLPQLFAVIRLAGRRDLIERSAVEVTNGELATDRALHASAVNVKAVEQRAHQRI
jgi:hypothetical protein